jgi:hypothetical protein
MLQWNGFRVHPGVSEVAALHGTSLASEERDGYPGRLDDVTVECNCMETETPVPPLLAARVQVDRDREFLAV